MDVGHDGVPSHWNGGKFVVAREGPRFRVGALDRLKLVTVQMPRVEVTMVVVEHYLNDFALLEDDWIAVDSVDSWIRCVLRTDGKGGVERWHFLVEVGHSIDCGSKHALVRIRRLDEGGILPMYSTDVGKARI